MASTRKIVVFDRISADGYFSAADGALDWAVPDADLDKGAAGKLGDSDTMLFGRRTYDMFESFWPNVMKDPATAPDPHSPGRHTPEMRALAVWINAAKKIVFSTTRKKVSWTNSELRRDIVPREIEALKAQPGKTIMLFGSGTRRVAAQRTRAHRRVPVRRMPGAARRRTSARERDVAPLEPRAARGEAVHVRQCDASLRAEAVTL